MCYVDKNGNNMGTNICKRREWADELKILTATCAKKSKTWCEIQFPPVI